MKAAFRHLASVFHDHRVLDRVDLWIHCTQKKERDIQPRILKESLMAMPCHATASLSELRVMRTLLQKISYIFFLKWYCSELYGMHNFHCGGYLLLNI